MPHLIDFDGLEQKLFVLQHICYGSRQFCETIELNRSDHSGGDYEWWEYTGLLKSIVSNTVIEASIKIRMLQDFVKADEQEVDFKVLDAESRENVDIGDFIQSEGEFSLRESCNKIVHATEAQLQWVNVAGEAVFCKIVVA